MFSSLPTCFPAGNIVFRLVTCKQFFKIRASINNTLSLCDLMFPTEVFLSFPALGNLTKHEQETMFARKCSLISQGLSHNII